MCSVMKFCPFTEKHSYLIEHIYQIFGNVLLNVKFYSTINDQLPVLSGNEQDLGHENIVNTYLFYQVYKVHDIVCFGH